MVDENPLAKIAREPMHARQILAIAILTLCTAAEGFDVYAISYAAPGIALAWDIDPATLGIVLAMDLVGMGIGAILLGLLADRIGRRPVILACIAVMASGMWLASLAPEVHALSATRLYTGMGVGGLLATSSAIVTELANDRRRSLAVTLLIGGFSLGALLGGTLVSSLLARADRWETVFEVGALGTAALFIPAFLLVPESLEFLCRRQPRGTLVRVNRILAQLGHGQVDALPSPSPGGHGLRAHLAPELARTAALLTIAFFMYMVSLYFLMKWIPKLVADMGYASSSAGAVLVWAQVGGLVGTVVLSLLSQRYKVRLLVAGAMACGAVAVALFGRYSEGIAMLTLIAFAAGFFVIGGNSGFYSIVAQSFPAEVRAAGTGFVIGTGRAGSAVGPIVAGFLFQAGWPLGNVSIVMSSGCIAAAACLVILQRSAR